MNLKIILVFIAVNTLFCEADENSNIIGCHTTDYVCFKRQYKSLRDHILLKERQCLFPYDPYIFQYGDTGTCVKISGLEESQLIGIRMNGRKRKLSLTWHFPLKIEQIINNTNATCVKPTHDVGIIEPFHGELRKFIGNATIDVTYPYEVKIKKDNHYLELLDEVVDIIVDVPDLSDEFEFNLQEFENSEWAFGAVQNMDVAGQIAAPHSHRFREFAARTPLESYIMLYPEEHYRNLQFAYDDDTYRTHCGNLFYWNK